MAIYTTLFVAADAELSLFFPGWRAPRTTPVQVERQNPFTQEAITVEEWDPGRAAKVRTGLTLFESHRRQIILPILHPEDDYQTRLEDHAPALLRTLPHSVMKGVTEVEMIALAGSLLGKSMPPARFVDCPEEEGFIGAVPSAALQPLAGITEKHLRKAAIDWLKALEVAGDADDFEWALRRVRLLATEAIRCDGHLFSHTLV